MWCEYSNIGLKVGLRGGADVKVYIPSCSEECIGYRENGSPTENIAQLPGLLYVL